MGKTVALGTAIGLTLGALTIGASAQAQQPGAPYPQPGMRMPPLPQPPMVQPPMQGGQRWGSQVGGRWWGGANAPGGWAAYHAPYRGYRLPVYWVAPRFYITDWSRYGFAPPPPGYYWTRYYDDAVLIDQRGQVYDSRHGLDWNRDGGREEAGYGRHGNGNGNAVVGAAAGAVVGGVAGNLIAGRGDRLAGTLIGAGVGGVAGYAIGRGHDGHRAPPSAYGEGDDGEHGYRREERIERRFDDRGPRPGYSPSTWVSDNGATTVTVTTAGHGAPPVIQLPPAGYGYGYGGGSVTTVTVQTQPVVTTTTTEVIDDRMTYARPAMHRIVVRKRVACPPVRHWRPKAKPRIMGS